MLEKNSIKEKMLNNSIDQFLQNGGTIEQATGIFEPHLKLITKNNKNEYLEVRTW